MKVLPVRTGVFREGEDLALFITKHIPKLSEESVLAVTSKVVALAEGRTAAPATARERDALIRAESDTAIKTRLVTLTLKDGLYIANAGIDDSNGDGKLVLLPKDSFAAAKRIRDALCRRYKIRTLGVVITDSRVAPLRSGVTGVALGYAGFRGLRDYRGKKDIFGRMLSFTQTNVADSLATAAALVMGEGAERQPLAVIEDAPVEFASRVNPAELLIPLEDDMYRPLFKTARRKKKR